MANLEDLRGRLSAASRGLEGVTQRRMFGCDGFFANGSIYGLIWKAGRIGLRLPDETAFHKAMALKGAAPWKAGAMAMKHWVLVPEDMHEDAKTLAAWTKRAHAMAFAEPAKPKKTAKKAATVTKARAPSKKATAKKSTKP